MIAATSTLDLLAPTLVMMVLVGLAWWGSRVARRRLGVGAGNVMPTALKVVGKRTLEQRKSLYVVEVAGRYILVGTAEHSVQLIDHITAEEFEQMSVPAPAPESPAPLSVGASSSTDGDATDADEDAVEAQRFMTVGESFSWMLDKARTTRASRAGRDAADADGAPADDVVATEPAIEADESSELTRA